MWEEKSLIERLEKHYEIAKGDVEELIEALGSETSLEDADKEEHTWYDLKSSVVKVGEIYVKFCWYHTTGDASWYDIGLSMDDLEGYIEEVKPVEVKTVKYERV